LILAAEEPSFEETEIRSLAREMVNKELANGGRQSKFSHRRWRAANSNFE